MVDDKKAICADGAHLHYMSNGVKELAAKGGKSFYHFGTREPELFLVLPGLSRG